MLIGYFFIQAKPDFATAVAQGVPLSPLFPMLKTAGTGIVRGLKCVALIGAFFWTSHVLAFIAKQTIQDVPLFVTMETIYLGLQCGLFGVLISLIYRGECST